MRRFAVLGHPVAHSLSPRIHRAFSEQAGEAIRYEALDVPPEAFVERLEALHGQGYAGLNVTVPHKAAALEACAERSPDAERAGAANTLTRLDRGWRAANTDGQGLLRDLVDHLGVRIQGRQLLLLGSGGAARGVLGPLIEAGPAELVVSGRTPWKVQALAEQPGAKRAFRPCTHAALKGDAFDVVIHATSAGHAGAVPRLPPGLLRDGATCYDLSYGDAHAPFRDWARSQGATRIHDGLGMLVEQAAASFALWFGQRPRTAPVIEALRAG